MKGRTSCPKCQHEYILDLPKDYKKHEVVCPKCGHKYFVKPKCKSDKTDMECSWEEHGEPRKTILSSMIPKTKKPQIAAILLVCVFSIGIATTVFSETFIETSLDVASGMGLKGEVELVITNQTNMSIDDAIVTLNDKTLTCQGDGIYKITEVELGIQNIEVEKSGYKSQKAEILVTPFLKTETKIELKEGIGKNDDVFFGTVGCSIIIAIFSTFALFAMIACIKRRHVDVALAGSFIAIFSFGFFLIGFVLSIISFILIYISRDEFKDGSKGKIF